MHTSTHVSNDTCHINTCKPWHLVRVSNDISDPINYWHMSLIFSVILSIHTNFLLAGPNNKSSLISTNSINISLSLIISIERENSQPITSWHIILPSPQSTANFEASCTTTSFYHHHSGTNRNFPSVLK